MGGRRHIHGGGGRGGGGGGGRRRKCSRNTIKITYMDILINSVFIILLIVGVRGVSPPQQHQYQPQPQPHQPPPERPQQHPQALPLAQPLTIGTRFRAPHPTPDETASRGVRERLNVGIIMPMTKFLLRGYQGQVRKGLKVFDNKLGEKYSFSYSEFIQQQMPINPSPTKILDTLCDKFLPMNVSAIIYTTKDEHFGRNTASSQYFLQLAGYLGIPVIAWNADNSGLEQASMSGLRIQMAPSIHHQAAAMLSILVRYQWHAFTIVTSHIAGHSDFVQTVRDQVHQYRDTQDLTKPNIKFTIIDTVLLNQAEEDLAVVVDSEARIMLLYSTMEEAKHIMRSAEKLSLTGKNYVWIVTQSVVGPSEVAPSEFPVGMLGVHFDTNDSALQNALVTTVRIFGFGVINFLSDPRNKHLSLNPQLSCEGHTNARWALGATFYRYLKNVSVPYDQVYDNLDSKREDRHNVVEFLQDGTRKDVELKIMNLRPGGGSLSSKKWEEIGTWNSWEPEGVTINDIVWPGHQHVPPPGVPEKFHLKIVFLEEPPYISLASPDPVTGQCSANRGILCRVATEAMMANVTNTTLAQQNSTYYQCCSGFCIDMLQKFSAELGFTYDLFRVEDGKWGTLEGFKWNGMVAELINHRADMALSSFKINSERESVIDFTVPFLESGIAILVAKRTGIISPTAFLEPFDTASWMLVAFVAIQVAALTVFLFEWLSPGGYNMKVAPPADHKFSLLRTYWLVWAVLFQAAVHVDCPKGFTARFMANIWAMFAVVFLAIYTANLAAFMITREEYHDLSGIEDHRLQNPYFKKPPFKFGFVPFTNTETIMAKHQPEMFQYMKHYNKSSITDGIKAIKKGEQDAFIYDATVLDYRVGQDDECTLLTVGAWYHMTGYGIAFPRGSKHTTQFNERLMSYKDNGDMERIQRFWLTGACKPKKQNKRASEPLALEQFLSAYLLLLTGVLLALVLLLLEHAYFKYVRGHLQKTDKGGCCALVSLSMGKSLNFRGAVIEAHNKLLRHRCRDPLCDTHIWKVKHELDMARVKIKQLEKELESHGVKPSRKFAPSNLLTSCWKPRYNGQEEEEEPRMINLVSSLTTAPEREMIGSRQVYGRQDMTRNHITSNEPPHPSTATPTPTPETGARQRSSAEIREIAEMETVL
ncbi:glutamate receptor ionotropic, NMDA 2B-like [Eriocheir sinensis]|uniref:glutamate receptor ionotropic, NMDA 2B-like n=1 Tax=Eriocheir sinensis TaxID=95602 RepID=UPI0021CA24A3|nr:glutamate receptor ionotropic, NMDA 2B-like [Eriocheir sinensis]